MKMLRFLLMLIWLSAVCACATLAPHTAAERDLAAGAAAYEIGDYAAALHKLEPIAEQGDSSAQTMLGNIFYLGLGVPEDNARAATWFRKAADQGDLEAQVMLATLYLLGAGVPQNYAEAAKWLNNPAQRGIGGAQFMLGMLYMNGEGVPKNLEQACMWMILAVERGSKAAREAQQVLSGEMDDRQMARAEAMAAAWRQQSNAGRR